MRRLGHSRAECLHVRGYVCQTAIEIRRSQNPEAGGGMCSLNRNQANLSTCMRCCRNLSSRCRVISERICTPTETFISFWLAYLTVVPQVLQEAGD